MNDRDPSRWVDRLVGACFGVFLAAVALYGAVQLVSSIWLPLSIGLAVLGAAGSVLWLGVWRWRRW